MSVKTEKSKNKDKTKKKKKQADSNKTVKGDELEKPEVKEATKSVEEKRPKKRKLDDADNDLSEPKSILKKKKKQKESPKTEVIKKGADDDDDIADEVLEQIAVDEDKVPLENPSFRPSGDSAEDADGQSCSLPSLKKKKEKMRAKKEEKRAKKASAQEKKTNSEGEEIRVLEAKEYLGMWKRDKDSWKFNKTKQTWLLKNMFHKDALDDSSFSILVDYLRPLKGKAREETIKQAEAKVNEDGVDFLQAERARVIVQMLA